MEDTAIIYTADAVAIVAEIVQQEMYKRSLIKWRINPDEETKSSVQLRMTSTFSYNDEFEVSVVSLNNFMVSAKTIRALMFGAGKMMRSLMIEFEQDYNNRYSATIKLHRGIVFPIKGKAEFPFRCHQLLCHPRSNSYDLLSEEQLRQEVIDHVLFGCNAIEMIPPGLDEYNASPHSDNDWLGRLSYVSDLCHQFDVMFTLWFPLSDHYDADPIYSALKRVDCVLFSCGHLSGMPHSTFFKYVREQTEVAKDYFPKVKIWLSPHLGLHTPDFCVNDIDPLKRLEDFIEEMQIFINNRIITGVVYTPWLPMTADEFRTKIPQNFSVRCMPDTTHNFKCAFPVGPEWDFAFSAAYGTISINPRPLAWIRLFDVVMSYCRNGATCYSEGRMDDVNKHLWSAMLWGMVSSAEEVMRDYTRWYCGSDDLYEIIMELEENWRIPLRFGRVLATMRKFAKIQLSLPLRLERNWRFHLIAFRVFCDAFLYMQQYGSKARENLRWPIDRGRVQCGGDPLVRVYREQKEDEEDWFDPHVLVMFGRVEASAAMLYALGGIQLDMNRFVLVFFSKCAHFTVRVC